MSDRTRTIGWIIIAAGIVRLIVDIDDSRGTEILYVLVRSLLLVLIGVYILYRKVRPELARITLVAALVTAVIGVVLVINQS